MKSWGKCDLCDGFADNGKTFYASVGGLGIGLLGLKAKQSVVEGTCCATCAKKIRSRRLLWILMFLVFSTGLFTITLPLALLFKELNWMPDLLPAVLLFLPLAIGFWIGFVSIPRRDRDIVKKSPHKDILMSEHHLPKFGLLNLVRRRILAFHLSAGEHRKSKAIAISSIKSTQN